MKHGFAAVADDLAKGKIGRYPLGQCFTTEHAKYGRISWRVIDRDLSNNLLTVMQTEAVEYKSFDAPGKGKPWGCNEWNTSTVREWLNGEFLEGFDADDRAAIMTIYKRTYSPKSEEYLGTKDKVFLLSASEAGFHVDNELVMNEGMAYDWFTSEKPAALRGLKDTDGDECYWWLRSPYPSNGDYVRYVHPSGALSHSYAYNGYGLAAACVIGPSNGGICADRRATQGASKGVNYRVTIEALTEEAKAGGSFNGKIIECDSLVLTAGTTAENADAGGSTMAENCILGSAFDTAISLFAMLKHLPDAMRMYLTAFMESEKAGTPTFKESHTATTTKGAEVLRAILRGRQKEN